MKAFFPLFHSLHQPKKDYSDGLPPIDHPEIPQRVDRVLDGFRRSSEIEITSVDTEALEGVRQLHDPDYVDFLLAISERLAPGQEYIPSHFRDDLTAAPLLHRGGMYCKETGSPVGPATVRAALNSAATAMSAAKHLIAYNEDVFAVCRPPGHHAGRRRYGGYCFFNNAYLAARQLNEANRKCAVLDLDYHLGDGSIEFANALAPYYSLHADPWRNYPYLTVDAELPGPHVFCSVFPDNSKHDAYLLLADKLIETVAGGLPQAVVVSLGFDTLGSDCIQDERICLCPADYARLGSSLTLLACPVLFLLEGGYDLEKLSECSNQLMLGFLSARRNGHRRWISA